MIITYKTYPAYKDATFIGEKLAAKSHYTPALYVPVGSNPLPARVVKLTVVPVVSIDSGIQQAYVVEAYQQKK